MKEKENLFLRVKRQRIDEVEMVEIKKSLCGKLHDNCFRKESSMDAKVKEKKFDKK